MGDFNGDGISDLAVSLVASVGIMLGNGDGTFKGIVKYPAPNAVMLALGDFNGDGNTDIVAGGQNVHEPGYLVREWRRYLPNPVTVATPTYPEFIVVADFNGDGKADLALTFSATN